MRRRQPLIAGNWKMNPPSRDEARALAAAAASIAEAHPETITVICPPAVFLAELSATLAGRRLHLGAQTMAADERGAFTGEISPPMLVGLADFVILGHSERRRYDGETDEGVARKVAAAVRHGLRPIVAIGESMDERRAGLTEAVIDRQLGAAISELDRVAGSGLVIAYEPLWAIGSGEAASPSDAQAVAARIRSLLAERDAAGADEVPILYGGSVTQDNALEFFVQRDVDGSLVGGASLDATSFAGIVAAAATSS